MSTTEIYDKVLGSLTAAAIGDGLGAPWEGFSYNDILSFHGKRIDGYAGNDLNPLFQGKKLGEITDDTSQMISMAKGVIQAKGIIDIDTAAQSLIHWSKDYPVYYAKNAGPTTRAVIQELSEGKDPRIVGKTGMFHRGCTNGALMRITPAGLTKPGDFDRAIHNAIAMTLPSHGTQYAIGASCSIACGISEALRSDATTISVFHACLDGLRKGLVIGEKEGRIAEGTDPVSMVELSVSHAIMAKDIEECEKSMRMWIGSDVSVQATLAVVLGFFVAYDGDIDKTLLSCVNIGGDTDTCACIAGSLCGALKGYQAIRKDWIKVMEEANPSLSLQKIAQELTNACMADSGF